MSDRGKPYKTDSVNFDLSIDVDVSDIERRMGDLSHKANLVMSRAVNRAASHVKTSTKTEVAKRYLVKQTKVSSTIKVKKASAGKPTAKVVSTGEHLNLINFKVRQSRSWTKSAITGKRTPKFYLASVETTSSMKSLAGNPKPFVAKPQKGGIAVFRRRNRASHDIVGVGGPAIPQMIKNKQIINVIGREANQEMAKRLEHEIKQMLK